MINRMELLISYSKKFLSHRRIWESEWNRNNTTELSYPQYLILGILAREGPKQPKDLINYLSITSGGITAISDKLISKGLLHRTRDEHQDRRIIYLEISDKGRDILVSLNEIRDRCFETLFACLTDAEIAFLEQIYSKLVSNRK